MLTFLALGVVPEEYVLPDVGLLYELPPLESERPELVLYDLLGLELYDLPELLLYDLPLEPLLEYLPANVLAAKISIISMARMFFIAGTCCGSNKFCEVLRNKGLDCNPLLLNNLVRRLFEHYSMLLVGYYKHKSMSRQTYVPI